MVQSVCVCYQIMWSRRQEANKDTVLVYPWHLLTVLQNPKGIRITWHFFHCVTRILKMPAQAKRRRIGEVSDKDSTSSLDESDADYQDEDPSEDPKVFFGYCTIPQGIKRTPVLLL